MRRGHRTRSGKAPGAIAAQARIGALGRQGKRKEAAAADETPAAEPQTSKKVGSTGLCARISSRVSPWISWGKTSQLSVSRTK